MLFRHIFFDTVQLASIAMDMPEVDEKRIGVMEHLKVLHLHLYDGSNCQDKFSDFSS